MANEYLNNTDFESIICSFQYYKREKSRRELVVNDLEETHQRRYKKYKDNLRKNSLQKAETDLEEARFAYKEFQDKLAYAFYILSENIAHYAKFSGIDVDDAIQEGVLICFEKVDRFNPNYRGKSGQKAKAFNYMTTCILNHFRQLYRSARNYNELKKKYTIFLQDKFEDTIIRNGKERAVCKSVLDHDSKSL
jgi:DNA-directed RNA polymerase specialized sigma24 family protein